MASEAQVMAGQSNPDIQRTLRIPNNLVTAELEGLYGTSVLQDMNQVLRLYDIYDRGAPYAVDSTLDYTPANLRYKKIRSLVDKEARFMFSKPPDFWVDVNLGNTPELRKQAKTASSAYQTFISKVLEKNGISNALLKAAKDCFISKRIAISQAPLPQYNPRVIHTDLRQGQERQLDLRSV